MLLLLLFYLISSQAFAATIRGKVEFGDLPAQPLVIKTNTHQQTFVRADGSFNLRNVLPGIHEVSVVDGLRHFTKGIVEVDHTGQLVRMVEVLPPQQQNSPPIRRETSSLVLKPIQLIDYFEKRQQMSLSSLVANPMMLMMLFMLGIGMIMPKLMENMDPEELKQMQDQMAQAKKLTASKEGEDSD